MLYLFYNPSRYGKEMRLLFQNLFLTPAVNEF